MSRVQEHAQRHRLVFGQRVSLTTSCARPPQGRARSSPTRPRAAPTRPRRPARPQPTNSPQIKIDAVKELGGTVELVGESFYEAQVQAQVGSRRLWPESWLFIQSVHRSSSGSCGLHGRLRQEASHALAGTAGLPASASC